jgi:aminoglycoside phosphotransferase (APT) family kinase protein
MVIILLCFPSQQSPSDLSGGFCYTKLMKEQSPEIPIIDYATFIKEKHERLFNTPFEVIDEAIHKATGSRIANKDRIIKGESNEVHSIETKDGQEVIIRIGHSDWAKESFEREKWALEECAKVGVPVPTVLYMETTELDGKPLSISIENKIAGTPLNEIEDISEPENKARLEELIQKSGQILTKIHSIKTTWFDDLDANGIGEKTTPAETLSGDWVQPDNIMKVAERTNLDSKVALRALEILENERVKYQIDTPSLVHSDYAPKHIMIDGNEITGIIDFENAKSGDPVRDLAYWDFFQTSDFPFEALKAGYENKTIFDSDFERKVAMWKIFFGLNNLSYYDTEKNQGGIVHCKKSLIRDIKLF